MTGCYTVTASYTVSVEPRSRIRPLAHVGPGAWRSRDARWTFLRHQSDPHPQRWFAYVDDDEEPANEGAGHVTLRAVADWAERQAPEPSATVGGRDRGAANRQDSGDDLPGGA
jgi:hypothetical protein